jgi:mannose-6-phosphate isomerase-like protein (cupin superfamily)
MKVEYVPVEYVPPGAGQMVDNGPIHIRILEDGTHTTHRVGITEVLLDPLAVGPPQHVHRSHEEAFYVVSGIVRFHCADDHTDVEPGGLITAPIGAPHTFTNPSANEPAIFVATYTPSGYIKYFQQMGQMQLGASGIAPKKNLEIMVDYDTEPFPPVNADEA